MKTKEFECNNSAHVARMELAEYGKTDARLCFYHEEHEDNEGKRQRDMSNQVKDCASVVIKYTNKNISSIYHKSFKSFMVKTTALIDRPRHT